MSDDRRVRCDETGAKALSQAGFAFKKDDRARMARNITADFQHPRSISASERTRAMALIVRAMDASTQFDPGRL
ncbi:hypothetical protein [Methylobacterium soli]|uniref:Uncharacterized protein n=1 Tax=Methylobacterium soli TaxID=553447 RepID=A0A6L3SY79_9HYPH|nr:hypothetical protein [Methylobacterium soli]KAB1078959.1 hypothetical protein F6X53_13240 [Methylobacterium soli]